MAQFGGVPTTEIANVTGALGVGAINMMSIFLFLDATTGVFVVVEQNAITASWAIFVAVPVLVASYVLGVLMIVFGGIIRSMLRRRAQIDATIALVRFPELQDHLTYEFRQFSKKRDLLEGMIPTSTFAAYPIWLEGQSFELRELAFYLGVMALLVAIACFVFAEVLEREFTQMLKRLDEVS